MLLLEDDEAAFRAQTALPHLYDRMARMIERQQAGDPLYVFLVSRLMLVLAPRIPDVMGFLATNRDGWDGWKDVRKVFVLRIVCACRACQRFICRPPPLLPWGYLSFGPIECFKCFYDLSVRSH